MSSDERPSDPATGLDELYDLVPQAEEIDLRDELERETRRRYWLGELRPLLDAGLDLDEADGTDPAAPAPTDEPGPWRLTDGQVVGMLEHLLGAEQVDGRPDRD